jgi:hypothetical protein
MKAKIYINIPGRLIAKRAPPLLRKEVTLRNFENDSGYFTLLVFPLQREIMSGTVAHILAEIPTEARIVAFGSCFTLESLALLKVRHVEIFAKSDYPWTDESLTSSRNFIASPVKFPS